MMVHYGIYTTIILTTIIITTITLTTSDARSIKDFIEAICLAFASSLIPLHVLPTPFPSSYHQPISFSSPPYRLPAFGTLLFGNSNGNLNLAIRCAAASVLFRPIFERSDSVSADTLQPSSWAYCVILFGSTLVGKMRV